MINDAMLYRFCLQAGLPFFGDYGNAAPGYREKDSYMLALLKDALVGVPGPSARILEIGSWVGASTATWIWGLRHFHSIAGKVVCVDAWESLDGRNVMPLVDHSRTIQQKDAAFGGDEAFSLFMHNMRSMGFSNEAMTLRGMSRDVLPLLKPASFALVFIDASHFYEDVLEDIRNSLPLVADGGILSGHDFDPDHPGVMQAVRECFGEITPGDTIWSLRREGARWIPVCPRPIEDPLLLKQPQIVGSRALFKEAFLAYEQLKSL